jgi:ferredoxin
MIDDAAMSPAHTFDDATRRALAAIVGAPRFVQPWLERFYTADEAALLASFAPTIAKGEGRHASASAQALHEAWRRGVLDRDDDGSFSPASFHSRYDLWAMFEDPGDVPAEILDQLAEWEIADYSEGVHDDVARARAGGSSGRAPGSAGTTDYAYVLLDEAARLVEQTAQVYLWPCDCRAMMRGCDMPMMVCLRFENDRDRGEPIDQARALEILREADDAGLMHTAFVDTTRSNHELGASGGICNCCADCCWPHLAAARLDAQDVWPRRRYRAQVDPAACSLCGICEERCPFKALRMADGAWHGGVATAADGPADGQSLWFDAAECRGCGLCATGCPSSAIAMIALSDSA